MKTAVELFIRYEGQYLAEIDGSSLDLDALKQAITEHDAEINNIIDNKIKELKPNKPPDNSTEFFEWRAKIGILTELKIILATNEKK